MIATQNPIEYEGTYPLPEAQLDRFLVRLGVGYPDREQEWRMLERRIERGDDEITLQRVVDRATLVAMQRAVEQVYVSEPIGLYIVDLDRRDPRQRPSRRRRQPARSLAVMKLARCRARCSAATSSPRRT